MIVITIVMMVIATGIPMMSRALNKNQLSKAVNDVLEGCKLARDRAILQNRTYAFVIRAKSEHEWDMTVEADKNNRTTAAASAASASAPSSKDGGSLIAEFPRPFGQDVAFELIYVNLADQMGADEARVRFFPNGTADEFTLIMHVQGKRRTIKVDIVTGAAYEMVEQQ